MPSTGPGPVDGIGGDRWKVLGPDGTVLGTRTLLHPRETEQPFTRSFAAVAIPESLCEVTVRARDKVRGSGGTAMTVAVPRLAGIKVQNSAIFRFELGATDRPARIVVLGAAW